MDLHGPLINSLWAKLCSPVFSAEGYRRASRTIETKNWEARLRRSFLLKDSEAPKSTWSFLLKNSKAFPIRLKLKMGKLDCDGPFYRRIAKRLDHLGPFY
ncbi:hypothetical protein V6N13_064266 [Hibiscus sabdariffa]